MIEDKDLQAMGFKKSGVLAIATNSQFEFNGQSYSVNTKPGVYLWLRRKEAHRYDVMYAGKAGNGVARRMSQHIGGIKRLDPIRLERIRASFGLGDCLEVWFRQSANISLGALFVEQISAYSTEEEALITRFSPQLNRAKPPAMRPESHATSKPITGKTMLTALNRQPAIAALDERLFDKEFNNRLHSKLAAQYRALLQQLATVCSTEQAKAVGLRIYYTDAEGRDLRVGWQWTRPFKVLLCIRGVGESFDSYTRAPADQLPKHVPVEAVSRGEFRQYRAEGEAFVENVPALISAILTWALCQRG